MRNVNLLTATCSLAITLSLPAYVAAGSDLAASTATNQHSTTFGWKRENRFQTEDKPNLWQRLFRRDRKQEAATPVVPPTIDDLHQRAPLKFDPLVGRPDSEEVSDSMLVSRCRSLLYADRELAQSNLWVQADRGVITLRGQVYSDVESTRAERIAQKTVGSSGVVNQLTVRSFANLQAAPPASVQLTAPQSDPSMALSQASATLDAPLGTTPQDTASAIPTVTAPAHAAGQAPTTEPPAKLIWQPISSSPAVKDANQDATEDADPKAPDAGAQASSPREVASGGNQAAPATRSQESKEPTREETAPSAAGVLSIPRAHRRSTPSSAPPAPTVASRDVAPQDICAPIAVGDREVLASRTGLPEVTTYLIRRSDSEREVQLAEAGRARLHSVLRPAEVSEVPAYWTGSAPAPRPVEQTSWSAVPSVPQTSVSSYHSAMSPLQQQVHASLRACELSRELWFREEGGEIYLSGRVANSSVLHGVVMQLMNVPGVQGVQFENLEFAP